RDRLSTIGRLRRHAYFRGAVHTGWARSGGADRAREARTWRACVMTAAHASADADLASSSAPLLRAQCLHKNFGGVRAVSDISFEVARGSVFAIIGPNGAGK